MTRARWAWLGALLGALIGLGLSALVLAPRGADHSCPAGSDVAACTYPPNLALWRAEWIIGGLIAGLIIGIIVSVVASRRRPSNGTASIFS